MKILLVDDDESTTAFLTKRLTAHHYVVDVVKDGEAGWTYGSTFEYDLIVLDVVLPKLDGISLCQRLRTEGFTTPILILTAQDNSTAKVRGLDAGADDYVIKPFDMAELIARIRALLRRGSANPLPLLTWGELLLNPSTCEVTYDGQPLTLTTKEYELLELLLRDSHQVLSAEEILDRLWSSEEFPAEATVRSHIRRLRQKLVSMGAPHDFITTLHGRGYYLKSSSQDAIAEPSLTASLSQVVHHHSDPESSYLKFLNETWETTKVKSLEQLKTLSQAVKSLKAGALDRQQQEQAQQITHKLADTLGIFGLTKEVQMARHLEHLLNSTTPLQSKYAPLIQALVRDLQREIQTTSSIQTLQTSSEHLPVLLVVDQDYEFTQSLEAAATGRGIRTQIAPTIDAAREYLMSEAVDAIVLRSSSFSSRQNGRIDPSIADALKSLRSLIHHHPSLPILILGNRAELVDRLEVLRRGGKLLLEQSLTPEQIIAFVSQLLEVSSPDVKVMIVDGDQAWLQTLPALLKPWRFKITTLDDPQQFWTVLQTVVPDVLVLDVNMPEINGFELCQVLRSDPHWQRLPVLFLSALTDSKTQNQAFTVGADDYLCKPVMGVDLAKRILNRLQRLRAWTIPLSLSQKIKGCNKP